MKKFNIILILLKMLKRKEKYNMEVEQYKLEQVEEEQSKNEENDYIKNLREDLIRKEMIKVIFLNIMKEA